LVQTTASTDTIAPSSSITSLSSGATVFSDTPMTVTGTASDLGGGVVGGVEVSVDNGATWHPADGRENWSYSWTPGAQGSTTVMSRAVDDSGNIGAASTGIPVTIGPPAPPNCPCSIWNASATPANASSTDAGAVEVGVRFRASVSGFISAIRFYKGASNTGTHAGHLWSNAGTLIGTAAFSGESASGWQEAAFPSPVAVTAGTTYVASYHTDVGRYAFDPGYFMVGGTDTPPLHALKDGVDGRTGVYSYGPGTFPSNTFQSTNYWVDVVFITSVAPDTSSPMISNVRATAGGNGSESIAWTTSEAATSRVDYGTTATALTSTVSDPALVTAHTLTLTGLAPSTTYFYRVTSADAAANSTTSPSTVEPPGTFTTAAATVGDTLATDFSAGTPGSGVYISETTNGEIVLSPAAGAEFSGSALPAGWQGAPWSTAEGGSGTGTVTVANGAVAVDGARAGATTPVASGVSLEFVATFTGQAFQNVGFAKDFAFNAPFANFSTISGGQLFARSLSGGEVSTSLGATWFGSPHRYRIDWNATSVVYSIDGNVVATHAIAIAGTMIPIASDFNTGGGNVAIDWMRLTPYSASGTFISRVFDAGTASTWGALSWTARTPSGTSVAMSVSASNSAAPATSCTGFTPISTSGGAIGATSRYIQYCAQLSTTDPGITPSVDDVTISYSLGPHATSTVVACAPSTFSVNTTTTCTATVTDTAGGGTTPTGTVSFSSDSGTFSGSGRCTLDAAGTCSVTYTASVVGPHTVTAPYDGDSGHAASSGSATITASTRSTTTSVSCAPATFNVNSTTDCTVTVADTAGAGATTPTGTMTVTADSGTFSGNGTCTLDANGRCTVTYTGTIVGSHTIAAPYGGDSVHATSSGSAGVTATARVTSTSVSCAPASVPVNGTTTCVATVTDTAGAGATTPTGVVSVTSDSGAFSGGGKCTLDASGRCSVTYTPSAIGAHTIAAAFAGDSTHTASSGSASTTAIIRSTSTSVSCAPTSVPVDGASTCTATVADTAGGGATTATGTVHFATDSGTFSGGGNCTLDATGRCSVTYTPSVIAPHTIAASYGGDSVHAVSNGSTPITAIIRSTSTSVSCSPTNVTTTTTCTATVTDTAGAGASTPTGTVIFGSDSGIFVGASCTVDGTGRCSVTYTPVLGQHTVAGSYGGDAKHSDSSGRTTVTGLLGH